MYPHHDDWGWCLGLAVTVESVITGKFDNYSILPSIFLNQSHHNIGSKIWGWNACVVRLMSNIYKKIITYLEDIVMISHPTCSLIFFRNRDPFLNHLTPELFRETFQLCYTAVDPVSNDSRLGILKPHGTYLLWYVQRSLSPLIQSALSDQMILLIQIPALRLFILSPLLRSTGTSRHIHPSKQTTLARCWLNVGPPSQTVDRHSTNIVI